MQSSTFGRRRWHERWTEFGFQRCRGTHAAAGGLLCLAAREQWGGYGAADEVLVPMATGKPPGHVTPKARRSR